jgi:broad specificity phosphatase PhoE
VTIEVVPTEIVIVQHAECVRAPGDSELTERGLEQAVTIARVLAESRCDGLWSSPLRRARETANIIGAHCGLTPVVDERLRERVNWDGTRPFDGFLADWQRASNDRTWTPPGGDSSQATGARMRAALDDIASQAVTRALVVSHGGATLDLVRDLAGDEAARPFADGIPNCALTTIVRDDDWRVVAVAARP